MQKLQLPYYPTFASNDQLLRIQQHQFSYKYHWHPTEIRQLVSYSVQQSLGTMLFHYTKNQLMPEA